jgi:hypothetical protein
LLGWAQAAGFRDVTISASVWVFATPDSRRWWAELWAERVTDSAFGQQALERGFATQPELSDIAAGFRAWAAADSGCWTMTHGELLAR